MLTNEKFFDTISENYDNMISFNDAAEKKKILLRNFVDDKTVCAADLGCGTGVDSIALSRLGLNVTAFDISRGMIDKAEKNAKRENCKINFVNTSITEIKEEHFSKYDLIVSLGNSLANLDYNQLAVSIKKIKSMLMNKGKMLIQILNYAPVLKNKNRIISITQNSDYHFVRFYDFEEGWLRFNILKFSVGNNKEHNIISTKIYPHIFSDFLTLLEQENFKNINLFGGLNKSAFEKDSSKDLVVFAEI